MTVAKLNTDGSEMMTDAGEPVEVDALAYVDVKRTNGAETVETDYIVWTNKAIVDAVKCGILVDYAEKFRRPFMPAPTEEQEIIMIRTTRPISRVIRGTMAPKVSN